MVAGFNKPTDGEVRLQTKALPSRVLIAWWFSRTTLLPWMTAFKNIYLGIDSVWPEKPKSEKVASSKNIWSWCGLSDAASKSQKNYPEA